MKLELEAPYGNDYRSGYLVMSRDGRRTVILFNSSKDRSTVSYARYLMAVKLGRYLLDTEHVDHIDNDKTNDAVENLQILSQGDNNRKAAKPKTFIDFVCFICGKPFKLEARQAHKTNPTCGKACGYKKVSLTLKEKASKR